ncbi:MAG TPA: S-methyl-5'-thioadenosine phosphorylase, partial [Miltoncostaeaceae bacterium]|nr:S-methyl-5'-thioadenosine phosphorylase [Miltoncostaeaceae bacterium]
PSAGADEEPLAAHPSAGADKGPLAAHPSAGADKGPLAAHPSAGADKGPLAAHPSAGAEIGIFGGSGFYEFLPGAVEVPVDTPYGPPSAPPAVASVGGRRVAFIPRHGRRHELPPHRIDYRANAWAMRELGVRWVLGPCASGALRADIARGTFVVCDQYVDRTSGRADTFYDGPEAVHVSAADPFSPVLRRLLVAGCGELGIPVRDGGTVVVVQGPRFSTRAESRWYASLGGDVINMTAYPEAHLARELELCYANVALVTDHDVGVGDAAPVSADEVRRVFGENNRRLRALLEWVIPRIPAEPDPQCARALEGARL